MADDALFHPLTEDRDELRKLQQWTSEMLEVWRRRKDTFVADYVMLDRWAQSPNTPELQEWARRLTYSPDFGQADRRLRDPRFVFMLSAPVKPFLPSNRLWHCMERLRQLRADALNHAFVPGKLAPAVQKAVYDLIELSESLADRVLATLNQKPAQRIPPEHRTRAMSKRNAAKYLGRPNPDSGVRWLNKCIEDGIISCETLSPHSHVFDRRQFPESVQRLILPS